jgi:hypothetical protein
VSDYAYEGGAHELVLKGENAESGEYMVSRFKSFLETIGFRLEHPDLIFETRSGFFYKVENWA